MKDTTHTVRERILLSAEKLFAEKGYEATTTRQIVKDAGTSLSAIQVYFKSKENLYAEVLRRTSESCYAMNRSICAQIDVSKEEGFLSRESIWDYIVQLVSTTLEWAFLPENQHKTMLMNYELLHPTDFYPLAHNPIVAFYNYFELLFSVYSGSQDAIWAKELSFIVVTTLFNIRHYPKLLVGVIGGGVDEEQANTGIKLRMKEYLFHSLSTYLDAQSCRH